MNVAAPPPTTALWDRLRATFARVIAVIGAPAAIALLSLATSSTRLSILRQLFMLESLVRKLLFAELATALLSAATERGPRLTHIPIRPGLVIVTPARKHTTPKSNAPDLTRPETWSASFALAIPRDSRLVRDRSAPRIRALWGASARPIEPEPRAPQRQRSTPFRIARRFEALRRVLNDPSPHIRRLAIAQSRALKRSPNVVSQYALIAPRRYGYDPVDVRLPIDITCAALVARTKLCDSS